MTPQLHKSTNMIAIFGSVFFLVSLIVLFVFSHLVSLQKQAYAAETTAQAEAEAHYAALNALMKTLDETKDERNSLRGRILTDDGVIGFLALIESLGKEQRVELTTSALTVEPINGMFETLVMSVGVSGSYDAVIRTLQVLEHLPYQSQIENVRISKGEAADGSSVWKSTYDLKVTKFKKQ